jgi:mono/diheme cytochrome c family protein
MPRIHWFLVLILITGLTLAGCAAAEDQPTPTVAAPGEADPVDATPPMPDATPIAPDQTPPAQVSPTPFEPEEMPEPDNDDENAENEAAEEARLLGIGEMVYTTRCMECHGVDGQGVEGVYPALAGSPMVMSPDPAPLIDIVVRGRGAMPAFGYLPDDEVAGVITYIRRSWGNDASVVTPAAVEEQR